MSPPAPVEQAPEEQSTEDSTSELSFEEGQNYIVDDSSQLPFDYKGKLGRGHFAVVEKVWDRKNKKLFAMKTMEFNEARLRAQNEDRFNNEVNIIRKLKDHYHIIKVYATYVAKREFGMILEPVATTNLSRYLDDFRDARDRGESPDPKSLERSFGCLASGLAYIHHRQIRHKDIKPENILVHQGHIIYTDFGISKAFTIPGESTTDGPPDFLTRRWSAPEVLDHDKRNYAADVYSLGCVFLDILSAVCQNITYEPGKLFTDIMDHVHEDLKSVTVPPKLSVIPELIMSMTFSDMSRRTKASQISSSICANDGLCCRVCHKHPGPSWTWSPAKGGYYSYVYDKEIVVETKWVYIDDP
ncbi:kinase-like domain-containing protein [Lophiotrema nucula]|uniref:non-specific serine/threonine protein kinase n=1 Tax=Lophiotrema nucula TaxID=690887 RepID=A0A6A5YKL4_9PLEO|nr:kinase-like domain-containing protein [Lophiotrema nucula]